MTAEESLELNFREAFNLPKDAIDFLMDTWQAIQVFDDVADGDHVKRKDLDEVIWNFFVGFARNPFFQANYAYLQSQLANMIMKWQASDQAEKNGDASAKSYMWRAGFYDVVLAVVIICHGPKDSVVLAKLVMDFYGETFDEYLKEFGKDA